MTLSIPQRIKSRTKILMCWRFFPFATMSLLYNDRVVIPSSLQKKILRDFHIGHPGEKPHCHIYWPNMDKDLVDMVDSCKGCALAAKAPATTCKPLPKTVQPWQRIHVDFAGPLDNQYYLIVVDSLSKWTEVLKCKRPTTNCTIGFLHELFVRFGMVDRVVTDNGTQFTSNEFKQFCHTYLVKHIMTIQYHPRSNGQAERFVDTLKWALRKAQGTPRDRALQQFLQVYKITPNPNTPMGRSPTETLFSWKIRSVFDKLIPRQARFKKIVTLPKKRYACGEKVLFKLYKNNITFWEVETKSERTSLHSPRPQEHT